MARVLLLGGTREALDLARHLATEPNLTVITSLAGRTRAPAQVPGELRSGGFGGAQGLARYLEDQAIDLLVDATHPFAATMAGNAVAACAETGVPRLKLLRPAWTPVPGDNWVEVANAAAAAEALPSLAERVFLTTGAREIAAFAGLAETWFLVRLIDPPAQPLPLARHHLVLARGPFDAAVETALMREHRIEAVFAKNSGGAMTYGKIAAARDLGLPVVMIRRPEPPPGETVDSMEAARAWVTGTLG